MDFFITFTLRSLKVKPYCFLRSHKQKEKRVFFWLSSYQYQYNGKEWQDELGLDVYDYGNRNYDAAIGRFFNMDRFSEKYFDKSNYSYAGNNPNLFIDVQGDSISIFSEQDQTSIKYYNGKLFQFNVNSNKYEDYKGKNFKIDRKGNVKIKGFLGSVKKALDRIKDGGDSGTELISALENCLQTVLINSSDYGNGNNNVYSSTGESTINWDANKTEGGPDQNGNTTRKPFVGLSHELAHALDALDGNMDPTVIGNIDGGDVLGSELFAMHWENRIRGENNISLRTHYSTDKRGNQIGRNLNPDGTSLHYTQQIVVPNVLPKQNINLLIPYIYK